MAKAGTWGRSHTPMAEKTIYFSRWKQLAGSKDKTNTLSISFLGVRRQNIVLTVDIPCAHNFWRAWESGSTPVSQA
jgi:hypothetical protein